MRLRLAVPVFLVLVTALALQARQAPRPASTAAAQDKLPPLSYVCPMPQDADVLEDKPGKCPKCGMELQKIRLDTAWSCVTHNQIIQAGPGLCPIDKRDLVQITVSVYFGCKSDPSVHELDPGKCAQGGDRIKQFERRPHGDHNPRHGGQFFMAEDAWHHLEGTYPSPGLFRVYFYNDFTIPMSVTGFAARVTQVDAADKEVGAPIALARGADGKTMQARIPSAKAPVKLKLHAKFTPTGKENVFDFAFEGLTRNPVPPASAPITTGAAAQKTPARPANQTPASMSGGMAGGQSPDAAQSALIFGPQETLPETTPELLAELTKRCDDVGVQLKEGALGAIWLPAIGTKDVALALESHVSELSDQQRLRFLSALTQLTEAAWQIDAYGDLGNKEKLTQIYSVFSAAVADIKSAYATAR